MVVASAGVTAASKVLCWLVAELDVWVSVDTYKPEVMRETTAAGAHLINDIRALAEPGALAIAAQAQVPVCLCEKCGGECYAPDGVCRCCEGDAL